MFPRGWDRIQQSRRDALPAFRRKFGEVTKELTNLVDCILELERQIGEQVGEEFSKMSTNQIHANLRQC